MNQGLTYAMLTEKTLKDVVNRILSVGSPLKIVLFGSHARGDAAIDSDLDVLIVEESDLPRHKRSARYRCALLGAFPSKDIVVWTPDEISEWHDVPNAFITSILAEGKILYER